MSSCVLFLRQSRHAKLHCRVGFTLVELLVVVAIIGILVGLLMPAVQNSRESARRAQCSNNLKQLGMATQSHITAHGFYPTGGWGHNWVGDPERGFRERQPGGWIYNLLPYLDLAPLHDLGIVRDPKDDKESKKKELLAEMSRTPVAAVICPSRRKPGLFPIDSGHNAVNIAKIDRAARNDYAANAGSQSTNEIRGPASLKEGDEKFSWPSPSGYSGISFFRSTITPAAVRDGASNTLLYGEKYLRAGYQYENLDSSDNSSLYQGFDNDVYRTTYYNDKDKTGNTPMLDDPDYSSSTRFGGPHPAGCLFVLCDGSVRSIGYSVDPQLFSYLGSRADDKPTDWSKF